MRILKNVCIINMILFMVSCSRDNQQVIPPVIFVPPFAGTIFQDPDIITDSDITTFVSLAYAGQATRTLFDRRVNNRISVTPFLFNTKYDKNNIAY